MRLVSTTEQPSHGQAHFEMQVCFTHTHTHLPSLLRIYNLRWKVLFAPTPIHRMKLCRHRKLGSLFLLQHQSCNAAQTWHVTVSESPVWATTHSMTSERALCMCVQASLSAPARLKRRREKGVGDVGWRERETHGGGRWALCCDVISWKLLCVVMLHPTEALNSEASYWLRERPHQLVASRKTKLRVSECKNINSVLPPYTLSINILCSLRKCRHIRCYMPHCCIYFHHTKPLVVLQPNKSPTEFA